MGLLADEAVAGVEHGRAARTAGFFGVVCFVIRHQCGRDGFGRNVFQMLEGKFREVFQPRQFPPIL